MAPHNSQASLMGLPTELFDDICARISQGAIVKLGRVCKELNQRIQGPLYYHAKVIGYKKLSLLQRTLTEGARVDRTGSIISKHIRDLKVWVDTNENSGNWSTAVVLGRMFQSLARDCPRMNIKLTLYNATCQGQPISAFGSENFPRVTTLILKTAEDTTPLPQTSVVSAAPVVNRSNYGRHYRPAQNRRCGPNKEYWTGIFNGYSFPDLQEVQILHNDGNFCQWYPSTPTFGKDDLKGLGRITRLVVTSAPELNDGILMAALPLAMSLRKLELKYVDSLTYDAISKLLTFALPNLTDFSLYVRRDNTSARHARDVLREVDALDAGFHENVHHLCPLIRQCGKNIKNLDIFLPYICREAFATAAERNKINEAGVKTAIGDKYGSIRMEYLDKSSIVKILTDYRKTLSHAKFQESVKENIKEAGKNGKTKAHNLAEYEEDQKNRERARQIKKESWTRLFRTNNKLCRSYETWEELIVLAGLEEPGIVWKLGHETIDAAAVCQGGALAIESKYDEIMPTGRTPKEAQELNMYRTNRMEQEQEEF